MSPISKLDLNGEVVTIELAEINCQSHARNYFKEYRSCCWFFSPELFGVTGKEILTTFCDRRRMLLLDKNYVHTDLLWASNIFGGKTSTGFESIKTAEGVATFKGPPRLARYSWSLTCFGVS